MRERKIRREKTSTDLLPILFGGGLRGEAVGLVDLLELAEDAARGDQRAVHHVEKTLFDEITLAYDGFLPELK